MRTLALILALSLPLSVFGYDRAEEVYSSCSANPSAGIREAMESLHCSGYLTGIVDGILMMQSAGPEQKQFICPPSEVSGEQTLQAVTRWLQQNPTGADISARVAVLKALVATYPCPQR